MQFYLHSNIQPDVSGDTNIHKIGKHNENFSLTLLVNVCVFFFYHFLVRFNDFGLTIWFTILGKTSTTG